MITKEDLLIFIAAQTHYATRSYLDAYLEKAGAPLTPPEAHLAAEMAKAGGEPISFQTLLKQMWVTKGTLSECLSGMAKKGWIEVIIDRKDRRRKSYVLSPKGQNILELHNRSFMEVEKHLHEGLSEEDIQTYFKVSHHLIASSKEKI